jgi:hypothetical protein
VEESPSVGEEHTRPVGVALRDSSSAARRTGRRWKGVQGERTVAASTSAVGTRAQLRILAARAPIEVERAQIVVGDHVREVFGRSPASASIQPPPAGACPPAAARDLAVGDIANEDVAEDVCGLAGDRRAALAAHELLAFERMSSSLDVSLDRPSIAERTGQKTLPTIAAPWTRVFSSGGSVSSGRR